MRSLARYTTTLPHYRSVAVTTSHSPRLRTLQGSFVHPGYVGRRTIFRTGTASPAGLNPRVGAVFLGLIGLGFVSTMIGVSVCYLHSSSMIF